MKIRLINILTIIFIFALTGCGGLAESMDSIPDEKDVGKEASKPSKAEKLLDEMTTDEKLYQLFFVTPEELTGEETSTDGEKAAEALGALPVGGIIYFSDNLISKEQTEDMLEKTAVASEIPLFLGIDEEGGRVSRLGGNPLMGADAVPSMAEIGKSGDSSKAAEAAQTIGGEIKELGFNTDFAPVADVLSNPDNTEIGDRSFSSDPEVCSSMVREFVTALQKNNVSGCLKHFPGHGSTSANSHEGRSESLRTLSEFRQTDFPPFAAGIESGVDFVMVSHMTAPDIDNVPCSVSEKVMSMLRNDLGFENIIITDAQNMGAITSLYAPGEAAVAAIKAGADMVLMPENLSDAFERLRFAVYVGDIPEERIDKSVLRILKIKEKRGLLS